MLQKDLPTTAALAFLGDAVHTRFVREMLVRQGITHSGALNQAAAKYVTATAQATAFERIRNSLTEEESDVARRAFNSTHINRPKHISGQTYRTATAFEAVLGMLAYLGQDARLASLLTLASEAT